MPRKEAGDFIPCTSDNNKRTPTKNWAYFSPPSIAGVSDWMVSVAMGLSRHGTFVAGFRALNHLCSTVFRGSQANWVITLNVFLIMLLLSHAKWGQRASQSCGSSLTCLAPWCSCCVATRGSVSVMALWK